jgi:TolB-like protein/Flp pilus assembly protein TadD
MFITTWMFLHNHPSAPAAVAAIRSLAILPLENLSHDAEQDFLADGMTDALITNLSQISSLKVISRDPVMGYKGTRKPLPDIAKELNVDGIVEGSVMRSGKRVRVDAQLIDASTGGHFRLKPYERNLSDVIALQNEVAQAITNEIQVKVTPEEQARLMRRESVDPQANEFYVKGNFFVKKRTKDSILKAIDYYQQAIQRDPKYAAAYAAMARAYGAGYLSSEEECSKRRDLAGMALQLDEGLAEAHAALADLLLDCTWDWTGAEREYQRAIGLNPNDASAHAWYGQLLKGLGRQNWVAETERALELDPVALTFAGGDWYLETGQYDRYIERARQRQELDPSRPVLYAALGRVYTLKGMYKEAIANLQKAVDLSEGKNGSLSALGYTYGVFGKRKEALTILHQLTLSNAAPFQIARVYVGLGEKDRAFDWLQKGVAKHRIDFGQLRIWPEMKSIRSDPRYAELLRRAGLPP